MIMRWYLSLSFSHFSLLFFFFFFSSRRRHTRYIGDWSSDVCSSDLALMHLGVLAAAALTLPIGVAHGFGAPPSTGVGIWLVALFAASIGLPFAALRSEERRVGKECRARGGWCHYKHIYGIAS